MKDVLDFLADLSANNDREWFNANKRRYLDAQSVFDAFALHLIAGLGESDPSVSDLGLKDCTYRIYRDIRFSADKSPYKTHMGVYVCKGGKKTWHSGYYLHIEPGNCMLVVGAYMPPKPALDSIREDILSRSGEFMEVYGRIKGFSPDFSREMKRMPAGFPQDSPVARFLRQRDYCLIAPIPEECFCGSGDRLLEYALEMFRPARGFNDFLNRAMDADF